jgi:hypothetical protein
MQKTCETFRGYKLNDVLAKTQAYYRPTDKSNTDCDGLSTKLHILNKHSSMNTLTLSSRSV